MQRGCLGVKLTLLNRRSENETGEFVFQEMSVFILVKNSAKIFM